MKVVFLESVEGTAQVGEVKDVKNGFARNYLLPRGMAAPAVEPYLRRAQRRAAEEAKHQDALDKDASAVAERLEGSRVTFTARVGEQGKLYGSVTSIHIAEKVAELIGDQEFDHRKVLLPESIREVGVQPVRLRLTRNIEAAIEVEVVAEDVIVAEEEAEPESVEGESAAGEESEAQEPGDVSDEPEASLAEAEDDAEEDLAEEENTNEDA